MKKKLVTLVKLVSLVILVATVGCARQGYPTGGPKDTAPPTPLTSKPDNGIHHFSDNGFYIQFDEYVVLKNPTDNILVSPPMKQQPEYVTKGKGIQVTIKDTLLPNTTYLFQFKDAIADFTEGNLLPSFEYVFSTGDAMDTLMLGGNVMNPCNDKPWKETVTVAAYRADNAIDDTIATSVQPDFITRCDKQGFFAFHHLPAGHYRLVAFEDKNRNLRLDAAEAAAWDTAANEALPSIDSNWANTYYISQPVQRQRITASSFIDKGRLQIVTLLPMQQPVVTGEALEWRLNNRRDTMNLWCLNPDCDSSVLIVSDEGLQDTLRLRHTPKKKSRRQAVGATEDKKPLMSTLCSGNKAFYDDLRLAFENPIVTMRDSAQAEIMHINDSIINFCPLIVDNNGLSARLVTSLKAGEQYRVFLRDSLFTDIYGHPSDSLSFTLTPKDYGTLTLHIDNRCGVPLVIEVLDKRDTTVQRQTLTDNGTISFTHLPADDYRLRAILDVNGDNHWTPGDYRLQRQPEKIIFFKKTLTLREKWEMEEEWTIAPGTENSLPMQLDSHRKEKQNGVIIPKLKINE